jgi:hypothetical protein
MNKLSVFGIKRLTFSFLAVLSAFNLSHADERDYWDTLYENIRKCVMQEIEYAQLGIVPKTKEEFKNFLLADNKRRGYYVIVDVSKYPSSDICYLQYFLNKNGNKGKYYIPSQIVLADIYSRITDAQVMKQKLSSIIKPENIEILEVK